jgi:putative hydrolase of the HAD superfamily
LNLGLIQAVTFDVGGTLIEPWPSVGHVYAEVAAGFAMTGIDPVDLNRQFVQAWKHRQPFDYSHAAWRQIVNQTFMAITGEEPSAEFFGKLYEHFGKAAAWRIFDDVVPTLEVLRRLGFRLGIISNWDERLRPLLQSLQLERHFEIVVISHEVRHTKPAREPFQRATEQFGLPPAAILHVGDSRDADVAGARQAGMSAILLDRRQDHAVPDALSTLRDLEATLLKKATG